MHKVKLQSITLNITDGKHGDCKDEKDSGYYFVSSKDINNGVLSLEGARQITKEDYEDTHKRTKLEKDDILITNSGTIGKMCRVKTEAESKKITFQKSVAIIKPDARKIDAIYLYYCFLYNIRLLVKTSLGSVQQNLLLSDLRNMDFEICDDKTQKLIAKLLSDIDSKIELNNRVNTELEAMAKTIYDYWFLQFEFPNEDDKPYKSSGGNMAWNEDLKRKIPKGWDVKKLGDIESNIITGKTPSTKCPEYYNGDVPFITIADIRCNMHIVQTENHLTKEGADTQTNKYISKGAICVTCIASPGLVGFATELSQTNQQINAFLCKHDFNKNFLYFAIIDYFKFSSGAKSGNTFDNMNKGDFTSIPILYPHKDILTSYYNYTIALFEKALQNSLQNKELTTLRDFLLPLLMNGQITVE